MYTSTKIFDEQQVIDERHAYSTMPESNLCDFIVTHLTSRDVKEWHKGNLTRNVAALMREAQVDCIQIWGCHDGPEPLFVNLC